MFDFERRLGVAEFAWRGVAASFGGAGAGRLTGLAIDGEAPVSVRRVHDVEAFLDRLAAVRCAEGDGQTAMAPGNSRELGELRGRKNVMTFEPDGTRGVVALVDGERAASI